MNGFIDDFRQWPYSSYITITTHQQTRLERNAVLTWFDGFPGFVEAHTQRFIEPPTQDERCNI